MVKNIAVGGRGRGNLSIDSGSLSAGMYNYSLFVDEKMVETRQMILAK